MSTPRVRLDEPPAPTKAKDHEDRGKGEKNKSLANRKNKSPERGPGKGYQDGRGKFAPGNPGGTGNPFAGMVHKYRMAFFLAVGPDKFRKLLKRAYMLALSADLHEMVQFMRFYADRTAGKVPQMLKMKEESEDGEEQDGALPANPDADPTAVVYE